MMSDKLFDSLLDKALEQAGKRGIAEALLKEWLELNDTPCRFDHHGYCQEHFGQEGDDCIVQRTRAFLGDN